MLLNILYHCVELGKAPSETRLEQLPSPSDDSREVILLGAHADTLDTSALEGLARLIRAATETIDEPEMDGKQRAIFSALQGSRRYKYSKSRCHCFAAGFLNLSLREKHVAEHERQYKCSVEGCYARDLGYASESALQAHTRSQHSSRVNANLFGSLKDRNPYKDIWSACETGDLDAVRHHISTGVDIHKSRRGPATTTPLLLAAKKRNLQLCRLLVENGASVFGFPSHAYLSSAVGHTIVALEPDVSFLGSLLKLAEDKESRLLTHTSLVIFIHVAVDAFVREAFVRNFTDTIPTLICWYRSYFKGLSFSKLLFFSEKEPISPPLAVLCAESEKTLSLMFDPVSPARSPAHHKNEDDRNCKRHLKQTIRSPARVTAVRFPHF